MPTRSALLLPSLTLLALGLHVGCKSSEPSLTPDLGVSQLPAPTFSVDAALKPTAAALPGPSGATRPVAAVADAAGTLANFVEQELLLVTDTDAELQAFLQRWKGQLLESLDPNAQVDGKPPAVKISLPKIHLVRIDASLADRGRLGEELKTLDPKARGAHRVSSDLGLATLAAAAHEAAQGRKVGVNVVMLPDTYADRQLADAPNGPAGYTPNAFDWTYMKAGGPLDIGVAEAWHVLDAAGKLTPGRIKIAIIDGGFRDAHADYPPGPQIMSLVPFVPDGRNQAHVIGCGASACPWHGTSVALAAAGTPDNGFAAAGPAGPVAQLLAIFALGDMFTSIQAVTAAAARGSRVINMSFSAAIPAALGFVNGPFDLATAALRAAGVLLFASAGNDRRDVDGQDCFLVCWENAWVMPCENNGVHCVGGVERNATNREAQSAYGRDSETQSTVDLAAPYSVFGVPANADPSTGADPLNPSPTTAFWFSGTSAASPFAAGVAALIWAAKPEASAEEIDEILLETARPLPGTGLKKLVNALNGVNRALNGTPGKDAGPPKDTGPAKEGASCSFVGAWKGTIPAGPWVGQTNAWTLSAGGTWTAAVGSGSINGTWKLANGALVVTDVSSFPAYLACPAAQEGTYAATFSADCKTISLKVINDPCEGRKLYLDGFSASRQ